MLNKKNILSAAALVCALAALALSVFAIGALGRQAEEIQALKQENTQLQTRLEENSAQSASGLALWTLTPVAWPDAAGADIAFAATPTAYREGMTAVLSIRLEGKVVESIPCQWDGSAFTAAASLPAADGYSYYCLLEGTALPLTTPENPVSDIPVYLASSLGSFCSLLVDTWEGSPEALTLTAAHAQVTLPRLSVGGSGAGIAQAAVVIRHDAQEIGRKTVTLEPGEGQGTFELTLEDITFPLPALEEEDQVDIWLEVTLSDGQALLSPSSGWYLSNGELYLIAG